ncbi:MAG: 30S ribosomal protein S17e [Candidatus Pacearchaeota archaeon]|nr:30S ribosomal protein S17e [Candidatus Pacearchaeota archaeon]
MGKIKSKMIRKSAKILKNEGVEFSEDFEKDKKILKGLILSKKLRNQLAGLMSKTKKRELEKTMKVK